MRNKYIAWFEEIGKGDVSLVGGKGANLGEMFNAGIPVPYGFVVTSAAYFCFIKEAALSVKIDGFLKLLNRKDPRNLQQTAENIQRLILKTPIPKFLATEIMLSYANLASKATKKSKFSEKLSSLLSQPVVAVRSSATAEDLPTASFAGQQETFLNITGETNVLNKVREAWASLFTARAIFYREEQKYNHLKLGIAVPVQIMVNSESSGVMFTLDPVTNDKQKIVIEAIYGLGELIVQGIVTPDHFEVDKKSLRVTVAKIATQEKMLVKQNGKNKEVKVPKNIAAKQKITSSQVIEIAKQGLKLEKHYYHPQDVEWAIEKGKIYIVQTRPVTTLHSDVRQSSGQAPVKQGVYPEAVILLKGDPASPGIAWGPTKIIRSPKEIDKVLSGDILIASQTNPDYVPAMKRAVAIITEHGGRTSHAAIVSRELGIPAIVGASEATKILKHGMVVTVNGDKGEVYKGAFTQAPSSKFQVQSEKPTKILKTATKVYVNMAEPSRVAETAKLNVDGIGLLRAEFMIADIGIHPKKLIAQHKEHLFITKLAADIVKFCHSFRPRPVIYRTTDFKTNEYRNLAGGREFEPNEANPMLGFRGAYRYICDSKVFELELEAIKLVRHKYGYHNLWLMIPFVRTVVQMEEVKKIIATSGLARSASFKLWMMVEIPSNVILMDEFCKLGIDGVSIGSNDLTMLILGTDRDNDEVAQIFDERNPAVLWALEKVIKTCHKYGVTSSICGQAPSDYPELVEKLVSWGITSISVNPDVVDQVRENIYNVEQKQGKR